ncbi:Cof-type HAD-IIB family hydrolase [Lacticaseibacillus baoqingensis]|uniref:Cof-type HAD-IIB family hydrolase n=1 Tax=Lacticaseibacillus baoqingensis TaxID=2486013 RepID=A0ABW4EAP5_9LACO|nr:HAD family hydrolase [Lacticaseibacillus baoqingensis]
MPTYAIFLDIDGTLVNHTQQPTPATLAAIAKYRQAGHHFFIATGRALFSARRMAARIGPGVDVIGSNGSVTMIAGQVAHVSLSAAALRGIYAVSQRLPVRTHLFTTDRVVYLGPPDDQVGLDTMNRIASREGAETVVITQEAQLLRYAGAITNGLTVSDEPTVLAAAQAQLQAIPDLDLSSSGAHNIELTKHGINKAAAIKQVCAQLEIPLAHTLAFGDSDNDLEMLTTVHYGVAMGNANAHVRAATAYATRDVQHDGVAYYLQQFFAD